MARNEARIKCSIWEHDRSFLRLPSQAQRLYHLILEQRMLSFAGLVAYTPRRWAGLAPDTTLRMIDHAADLLEAGGFVVIDRDTEECWVRTLVRNDGVLDNPKLAAILARDLEAIVSAKIRKAYFTEYGGTDPHADPPADGGTDPPADPHADGGTDPHLAGARAGAFDLWRGSCPRRPASW